MIARPKHAPIPVIFLTLFFYSLPLGQAQAGATNWDEKDVKSHCATEWPNDFAMQDYCVTQNKAGYQGYVAILSGNTDPELVPSFSKCESEWGIQWDMVEYCSTQQIEGKSEIAINLRELPPDVAEIIENMCRAEWGSDFGMVAYCSEQNATGWQNLNN